MHFSTSNLASLVAAVALTPSLVAGFGYNVTNMITHTKNPKANSTISFHVLDPDQYSNNSQTTCHGSWAYKASPPTSWQPCANETFEWMFGDPENAVGSFINGSTYGLSIKHSYIDPAVGDPPYNVLTTFGREQINGTIMGCENTYQGLVCSMKKGAIVHMPIWAQTA